MAIDITKRAEKVGIVLEKKNLRNIQAQVKLGIDRSGSMDWLYSNGVVQDIVERILAVGMQFDLDKSIDVWAFSHKSYPVKTVSLPLVENYVKNEIEQKIPAGATSYAPCFQDIVNSSKGSKGFFGFGKKEADPTLAIFITDGENDDENDAEKIIKDSQDKNIYWLLVGIGDSNFRFIEKLGDKYPNAGFIAINDISTISDDDLYSGLLNDELAVWFSKFKK